MKMRLAIGLAVMVAWVTPALSQTASDCAGVKAKLNGRHQVVRCGKCDQKTKEEAEHEAGQICLGFVNIPATVSGSGSEVVKNWEVKQDGAIEALPDTFLGHCDGKSLAQPPQASGCTN